MDGTAKTSITDIDFSEASNALTLPLLPLKGKVILPNVFPIHLCFGKKQIHPVK